MREKERNLRRDGNGNEREDSKDLHRREAFLHEDIFFYFIIMTGKLTMTFSLVSSTNSTLR